MFLGFLLPYLHPEQNGFQSDTQILPGEVNMGGDGRADTLTRKSCAGIVKTTF